MTTKIRRRNTTWKTTREAKLETLRRKSIRKLKYESAPPRTAEKFPLLITNETIL